MEWEVQLCMTIYNVYSVFNFVMVDLYLQYMHMESSDICSIAKICYHGGIIFHFCWRQAWEDDLHS
jgi:hypothetical protein